jgi:hypothetical protein
VSFERKHAKCMEVPIVLSNFGNICEKMGEYTLKHTWNFKLKTFGNIYEKKH